MKSETVDPKAVQTFKPSQWIGLVMTYLFIPLILLACGWDIGWWQAWIYSALVFAAGVGGRIWTERRHPGLMAERIKFDNSAGVKPWDKVLSPLMSASGAFPLVIVAGLDHHFG